MKTGVALFNSVDAEGRDAVAHESNEFLGWALDGFPIYGPRGKNGTVGCYRGAAVAQGPPG